MLLSTLERANRYEKVIDLKKLGEIEVDCHLPDNHWNRLLSGFGGTLLIHVPKGRGQRDLFNRRWSTLPNANWKIYCEEVFDSDLWAWNMKAGNIELDCAGLPRKTFYGNKQNKQITGLKVNIRNNGRISAGCFSHLGGLGKKTIELRGNPVIEKSVFWYSFSQGIIFEAPSFSSPFQSFAEEVIFEETKEPHTLQKDSIYLNYRVQKVIIDNPNLSIDSNAFLFYQETTLEEIEVVIKRVKYIDKNAFLLNHKKVAFLDADGHLMDSLSISKNIFRP